MSALLLPKNRKHMWDTSINCDDKLWNKIQYEFEVEDDLVNPSHHQKNLN